MNPLYLLCVLAGQLSSLVRLNISFNEITRLPSSIARLSRLEDLLASQNQIHSLPRYFISTSRRAWSYRPVLRDVKGLVSLRELDLGHNCLYSIPEELFLGATRMTRLLLAGNKLKNIPSAISELADTLTILRLHDNQLEELPAEIGKKPSVGRRSLTRPSGFLVNLKELNIDRNILEALPAEIDQIEDQLDQFTYEGNPFCQQIADEEALIDLLIETSKYAQIDEEIDSEEDEVESAIDMLREGTIFLAGPTTHALLAGEAFTRYAPGQSEGVRTHVSVDDRLEKLIFKSLKRSYIGVTKETVDYVSRKTANVGGGIGKAPSM